MGTVSLNPGGLRDLRARSGPVGQWFSGTLEPALLSAGAAECPRGTTGALAQSLSVEMVGGGEDWMLVGGHDDSVDYARPVHDGSPAHEIHGNPILRFEAGGEVLFRRMVNHPGTPGDDYWQRALDTVVGSI